MNFTSVPQGGLRKYCIDSQNWWRAVIIAPVSQIMGPVSSVKLVLRSRSPASMSLHVQGQVVRSGEGSVAEVTLEGLGARVLPVVTSQLV